MQEFLLISIILILLFRTIRRFIFFNTNDAFQKAAEQFYKKQEMQERQDKTSGKIIIEPAKKKGDEDEYIPYEEIK